MSEHIALMCLNVHGGIETKLKINDFNEQLFSSNDIVLLSETWSSDLSDLDVNGFECLFKNRVKKRAGKRQSGGLVCYFKKNIWKGVQEVPWNDNEDGMVFKLDSQFFGWEKDKMLVFTYMRPNSSSRNDMVNDFDCYDMLLDKIAELGDEADFLLCGDYNARLAVKDDVMIQDDDRNNENTGHFLDLDQVPLFHEYDFSINNMSVKRENVDRKTNTYGSKLLELLHTCSFLLLNGRCGSDKNVGNTTCWTHKGSSTIDYIICDKNTMYQVSDFIVHGKNIHSDHNIISCKLKCNINVNSPTLVTGTNDIIDIKAKWREERATDFVNNIKTNAVNNKLDYLTTLLNGEIDEVSIDRCLSGVQDIFTEAGTGHIFNTVNSNKDNVNKTHVQNKWYDFECLQQRNMFYERLKRFKDTQQEEDRIALCKERNEYRKLCRIKRREFDRGKAKQLSQLSKQNTNEFWKQIKLINSNKSRAKLPDIDFFNHFKNLAGRDTEIGADGRSEIEEADLESYSKHIDFLDAPFSLDELSRAIKDLKKNKSAGLDLILNEFIINASNEVKVFILLLFNCILRTEYFPRSWAEGNIIPIFKKGERLNTDNYRGITILSCLGKLFTRLLNIRLEAWADAENILSEAQYGFRKGRGTADCLFIIQGLVDILFAKGKKLYACFVDYEKAFDYLDRASIYYKLFAHGLSSKLINILKSFYSKMRLTIKGGSQNQYFSSNCGLLQGETTSPFLFSLFVNDLENNLDTMEGILIQETLIKMLMFADDMAIFSDSREGLQKGLDDLKKYCTKWGLKLNTAKTKVIVFKKGGRTHRLDKWNYGGENIEVVSCFKYLGCNLSATGSFSNCIQELIASARRALFSLKKTFHKNKEITPSIQLKLFNTMIVPILNYGSEVWGLRKADPIERFHLAFLKYILHVKSSTPTCYVYGELGTFPLLIERQVRVIKYWTKLIGNTDTSLKLPRLVYNELLSISNEDLNVTNWASLVRDLLLNAGMGIYWYNQHVGSVKQFLSAFRQRLQDVYLQNWFANVSSTSTGRLFIHIKDDFGFESYLHMTNKAQRVAITKFRLSSHLFNIERGRWRHIIRNERKCTLCDTIEDEYHCLIECPRYVNERKCNIPVCLRERPSMFRFIQFLKSENEIDMSRLGKLCFKVQIQHKLYI